MINKFKDFVDKKAKKVGDFFSIMCPKCNTRMEQKYHMVGAPDSMYWVCPNCNHKKDMPDIITKDDIK